MQWYYAGPDAKPVGPVTLEELHSCRVRGIITPETYIIEHTDQPGDNWSWKRYKDVFPSSPNLPPIPSSAQPPPASAPAAQPHPLFPSAAPVPAATRQSAYPAAERPDPYYANRKTTNSWCAWGFGFALAGCIFTFVCGLGVFPALLALPLCIVGLADIHKHREQSGHGLAIAGLIMACVALLVSLLIVFTFDVQMIKGHGGLTVTEETSNDSE